MQNRKLKPTNRRVEVLSEKSVTPPHDWKSNPVVISAGTAAATFALCIGVVTGIVIPTQTARLENDALKAKEEARQVKESLAAYEDRSKSTNVELAALKRNYAALAKELKAARASALLSPGSPYPSGLSKVSVGMPVDAVYRLFAKDRIELEPDIPHMVRVNLQDSPFEYISYHYSGSDPRKLIRSIAFHLGYKHGYPDTFLFDHLTTALGKPVEHREPHYYRWRSAKGVDVYMLSDDSYSVMAPRYAPAIWPDGS